MLQGFVLVFNSSVWELTSEVVWMRSTFLSPLKSGNVNRKHAWSVPVLSAWDTKTGSHNSWPNALTEGYTYQVPPSRVLWHISECRWQCLQSLCWARYCQDLGSGILGVSAPGVFRQRELRHSTGVSLGAQVPGSSAPGNLASHHTLHTVGGGSQPFYAREQRHAINVNPSFLTC